MQKVVIGVIVAAILVGGAVWFMGRNAEPAEDSSTESSTTTEPSSGIGDQEPAEETCPTPPANTVSFCEGTFNSITVKMGTAVTFRNDSEQTIQPSSDPHPVHTDNSELNVGVLKPGESKTITLDKKGTWGIHDHLNSSQTGMITVE